MSSNKKLSGVKNFVKENHKLMAVIGLATLGVAAILYFVGKEPEKNPPSEKKYKKLNLGT